MSFMLLLLIFLALLCVALYPVFGAPKPEDGYYNKKRGWRGKEGYCYRHDKMRQKGINF